MKVGIITQYYNSENYGGLLQAYALNRAVRGLGCDCETISYSEAVSLKRPKLTAKNFKLWAKYAVSGVLTRLKGKKPAPDTDFVEFREGKIPHSKAVYDGRSIEKAASEYDLFICGSDRIWHTRPLALTNRDYFLAFAGDKPKVAYAASAEVNELTPEEADFYRKMLLGFSAVSLRESMLLRSFEKYGVYDGAEHVLDPVFLLGREEWGSVCAPSNIGGPYMFVYALGNEEKAFDSIDKEARKLGLKVVAAKKSGEAALRAAKRLGWTIPSHVSPERFVGLVRDAAAVATDSFHCTAFSLIFGKSVYIVNRDLGKKGASFMDRINSILELMGVPAKGNDEELFFCEPDAEGVEKNIVRLRKKSLDFLKNSLSRD